MHRASSRRVGLPPGEAAQKALKFDTGLIGGKPSALRQSEAVLVLRAEMSYGLVAFGDVDGDFRAGHAIVSTLEAVRRPA